MNGPDAVELLLIEDDPQDLELVLRALGKSNLNRQIHVARYGAEALDFVFCEGPHAGRDASNVPRVILLDLKLPKINGLEVLRRIRADSRTDMIPVVVLTSSKERSDVVESYRLGVSSYVVKPVNSERFSEAVRNIGLYWLLLNLPPGGAGKTVRLA